MNLKIATGLVAVVLLMAAAPWATSDDKDKDNDNARTVTGCLQKGDEANEYVLMAKDGSTWDLRSETVDLASHVGHTVTVTGTASTIHAKAHEMKEGTKEEMHEHGMAKNDMEHGHLKATKLTMVSESCKK